MKFLALIILGFSFLGVASGAEAFNNGYRCTAVAETTVGYAPASNKVEADAGKVKNPYTVRLSGVASDAAVLHAQQVVPLVKLVETQNVIWFAEKASAGTMTIEDESAEGEQRFVTLGANTFGSLMVVVWTSRDDDVRIISVRKPTRKERRTYEEGV